MKLLTFFTVALFLQASMAADFKTCQQLKDKHNIVDSVTCLQKKTEKIIYSIHSVEIKINCSACEVLHGDTEQDVKKSQRTWSRFLSKLWSSFTASTKTKDSSFRTLSFSPFVDKYIMIKPERNTTLRMQIKTVIDLPCVFCLLSGLILFFSAPSLSSSVKFYYTSGFGIGVIASMLILFFILSRLVPKKPAAYTILLGGWSFTAYIMTKLFENWQTYILEYHTYFIMYVALVGFLSFALCYWKGPIEDPRTRNILQWTIQIFGLILIYNGTQLRMVSSAIIAAVLLGSLIKNKPDFHIFNTVKSFVRKFVWWRKPEPIRFLTEEEYRIQGEVETKKALDELRKYCDSPQWSPHRWKTMSKIKSPSKFASFLDGESHVSDAELTLHDADITDTESEDDMGLISSDENDEVTDDIIINNGKRNVNGGRHKGDNFQVTVIKRVDIEPEISEDED